MRIFDRIGLLRALIPAKSGAADLAARWSRAQARDPELARDLIRLGGVLTTQPSTYDGGVPLPEPIDPMRLAYEAGRRDLAVQLLGAMTTTPFELSSMMEEN